MLAAFRANRRDAESLRRHLCHIATIQGTMLLGVATPGRQRGVIRWNPTNRRALQAISDPVDLWQSGWDSVTPHFSVNAEHHRPHRDRPTKGGKGWKSAEMRVNINKERQSGVFKWGHSKLESNMEPIRSCNKGSKPAISPASQGFVLILLRRDNGKPVVCEPRALIRPQQRSPVLFSLTQQKQSK